MKRIFTLLIIFITFTVKSQTMYFPPVTGSSWDTVSPASLGWCPDQLDSLIHYVGNTNAKAFIILKNGKIVVEKYYGTFTKDSLWYWASAGKTMTSFLTGLAQEQGYLHISDSVSHYLGNGWSSCSHDQEEAITIRHQLTMTTGFNDMYGGVTTENPCTSDSCLVCIASPGTRWAYHNGPYTLIHHVIDSATKMTVNAFKNLNLISKTGIGGIFMPNGYDQIYYSKASAFARFGLLIQNHGIWNSDTIMHDTAYFNQMTNTSQNINLSYGYLWWLNGKASFHMPNTQYQFNGSLMPHAPPDLIAALGKNDQLLNIVPSLGIVMIRMGNPMYTSAEVPNFTNDSIWVRFNKVLCNITGIKDRKSVV